MCFDAIDSQIDIEDFKSLKLEIKQHSKKKTKKSANLQKSNYTICELVRTKILQELQMKTAL